MRHPHRLAWRPDPEEGVPVRWWEGVTGLLFMGGSLPWVFLSSKPMTTRREGRDGVVSIDDGVLPLWERFALLAFSSAMAVVGLLLVGDAVPELHVRPTAEALLRVEFAGLLACGLAVAAVVAGLRAWDIHAGSYAELDRAEDAEGILVGLMMRTVVGAALLSLACGGLAVLVAISVPSAWGAREFTSEIDLLEPLHGVLHSLGLGALSIGIVMAVVWVVYSLFTEDSGGPGCFLLLLVAYLLFGVVIAWPFGFAHSWFGVARWYFTHI